MLRFKGHWLTEVYNELPKHTRVQVVSARYFAKELNYVERERYYICSTPLGIVEIPKEYVELVPWWAD